MKTQKIKVYCNVKECEECKIIDWNGKHINQYFCPKHAYRKVDQVRGRKD